MNNKIQAKKTPQNDLDLSREARIKVGDEDSRSVEISFSSEEPYDRWFGREVLSHADGAIDLSRLNEIGVLLFNHDRNEVIGKIDRAWIESGRGKALVTFDGDEKSETIFQKVKSGTLKGVSVGYLVKEWDQKAAPEGEPDTWTATSWQPYEISIVSIPADASVGVGRELTTSAAEADTLSQTTKEESIMDDTKKTPDLDQEKMLADASARAVEAERSRVKEIGEMCRGFDIDPADMIAKGMTVDAARAAVLEQLKTKKAPARVELVEDEGDKFRAAAIDAMIMRSGGRVAKPAAGANDLRGMSLKDLAVECMAREHLATDSQLRRMSADDLFANMQRQAFNPTSAFPAILDATIRKNIVQIYQSVPTTFEAWTSKGTVSDFKATRDHNYIVGGGAFEQVAENGELKASKPSTELVPTRKVETYGTQFTMSRQAFVNDDLGFLSQVPGVYAAAAKRKINQQVYDLVFSNGNVYDGKTLFHADHKNLVSTGAAPSLASINALMLKLQTQTDPFGEAINVVPRCLILPIGYGMTVDTVLHSASIKTSDNDYTGYNPLANKGLVYVEDAALNALAKTNACPWFIAADPMSAKSIQVDYLNGIETPTIRRSEVPGQLGFVWDIWMDWGISVIDFRGIARNAGVKVTI